MDSLNKIQNIIKFVKDNKDIPDSTLNKIQELLSKGRWDEYDPDAEDDSSDLDSLTSFDPDNEEEDSADEWLNENDPNEQSDEDLADQLGYDGEEEADPEEVKTAMQNARGKRSKPEIEAEKSDNQLKTIDSYVKDGYTQKEAENLAGGNKRSYSDALQSGWPDPHISPKFLEKLKGYSTQYLKDHEKLSNRSADPSKNPSKYAAGQMEEALSNQTESYDQERDSFLDTVKDKDIFDQMDHHSNWENDRLNMPHHDNYNKGWNDVVDAQGGIKDVKSAKENSAKLTDDIMSGNYKGSADSVSAEAAAQSFGEKTDRGNTVNIKKDRLQSFVAQNKDAIAEGKPKMNTEHAKRLENIDSARSAQGVPSTIRRKKEE